MIKALTFDAAGTLIRTAEPVATVYARLLATYGHTLDESRLALRFPEAFATAGDPDFVAFPNGDLAERKWWRQIVESCVRGPVSDAAFNELFSHYAEPSAWEVMPGVLETLRRAKGLGYRLAVVSNFDSRLHGLLRGLGLVSWFEVIVTSADAQARKPSPQIFLHALKQLGLSAHEVCHVGDSESLDVRGAAAAGINAFLIDEKNHDLRKFLSHVEEANT